MDVLPKQLVKLIQTINKDTVLNSWRISNQKNAMILSIRYVPKDQDQGVSSQPELQYKRKSPSTQARDSIRQHKWLTGHGNQHEVVCGGIKTVIPNVNNECADVSTSAVIGPSLPAFGLYQNDRCSSELTEVPRSMCNNEFHPVGINDNDTHCSLTSLNQSETHDLGQSVTDVDDNSVLSASDMDTSSIVSVIHEVQSDHIAESNSQDFSYATDTDPETLPEIEEPQKCLPSVSDPEVEEMVRDGPPRWMAERLVNCMNRMGPVIKEQIDEIFHENIK